MLRNFAASRKINKIGRIGFLVAIPLIWLWLVLMYGISQYDAILGRARSATNHLQSIQNIAKTVDLQKDLGNSDNARTKFNQIKAEFAATQSDLDSINASLKRYRRVFNLAKVTPLAPTINTAEALVDAGSLFIQAGNEGLSMGDIGLDIISKFGKNSNTGKSDGLGGFGIDLDQPTLVQLKQKLANANRLVNNGVRRFNQIPLDRLSPGSELYKAVTELQRQLPTLTKFLSEGERGLATVEALLGYGEQPATYLVLVQDGSEIRPTGGFIGNYAVVNMQAGKLGNYFFDNVYKLDDPYRSKQPTKAPEIYATWWFLLFDWGLRDVNLTPDFPEVAKYAQDLAIKRGAATKFDGVVAVNFGLVQEILRLTGPITVKEEEFDDTVTADNLVDTLHKYQLAGDQFEGAAFYQRKRFTSYFAQKLIERVKGLPKEQLVDVVKAAVTSLDNKDLLVYFNDSYAQKWLETQNWAGRIERRPLTPLNTPRDYFMQVDTNSSGNKANGFIQQSTQDTVSINADGTTRHQLTVTYNYNGQPHDYEKGTNGGALIGYTRFYLPRDSIIEQRGEFPQLYSPVEQYEKTVIGQYLTVVPTQLFQTQVSWLVPATANGMGRDKNGRLTYNLLVQRQPAANLKYELKVKPPAKMRVAAVTANQQIVPFNAQPDGAVLVYSANLTQDTNLTVYFEPL